MSYMGVHAGQQFDAAQVAACMAAGDARAEQLMRQRSASIVGQQREDAEAAALRLGTASGARLSAAAAHSMLHGVMADDDRARLGMAAPGGVLPDAPDIDPSCAQTRGRSYSSLI